MKKTIYMIFLVTGIIATMTACSSPSKEEQLQLSQEVEKVSEENQKLKDEIQLLQQNNQALDEEIAKLDPTRVESETESESTFVIYTGDSEVSGEGVISKPASELSIKDNLALEGKLETLAKELSKTQFEDLSIGVLRIEEQEGKKIAVIDLTETGGKTDISWKTKYFQGSAGGGVTEVSLIETFLQKEYQGEWIDGVQFLYGGQTISFDHVPELEATIER